MTAFEQAGLDVAALSLGTAAAISLLLAIAVAFGYGLLRSLDPQRAGKPYHRTVMEAVPFLFLLALVGSLTGQLGGESRTGVVGEIVPPLITVFGGFLAYFLGTRKDSGGKVAVNTLAFLLGFFALYNLAAVWRQEDENFTFCRDLFSDPAFASLDQRKDRQLYWYNYCKDILIQSSVELPDSPPS